MTTKGEKTREKLIAEAKSQFARFGFHETSIRNVADRCGLSQAAVFRHFPDRESLVAAVIDSVVRSNHESVDARIGIEQSGRERLLEHIQGNLEWKLRSPNEAQILILLYYFSCFSPKFAAVYNRLLVTARRRVHEYLLAGEREGHFDLKDRGEEIAATLHDTLVGAFINLPFKSGASQITREKKKFVRLMDRLCAAGS
jgi:AcrR family transcriptional regulator